MANESQNLGTKSAPIAVGKSILGIQLSSESVDLIRESIKTTIFQEVGLFDENRLEQEIQKSSAIFCSWDGINGKIKGLISELRKNKETKKLPLYVILPANFKTDKKTIEKMKVTEVIEWPIDSYKIPTIIYCMENEDDAEDDSETNNEDDIFSSELKVKTLEDYKNPKNIQTNVLVAKIMGIIAARKRKQIEFKEIGEGKDVYSYEQTLIYHPKAESGNGLVTQLKLFGFPNVTCVSEVSECIKIVSSQPVKYLLAWYSTTEEEAFSLIRELNESRNLGRCATVVLVPGETAAKKFATDQQGLLVDKITILAKQKSEFQKEFEAIKNLAKDGTHHYTAVYSLRASFRTRRIGIVTPPINGASFDAIFKSINENAGPVYWPLAERALHAYASKDKETCLNIARALHKEYKTTLDPTIILGHAKALNEGISVGATWVVNQALVHRALNLEKCYQIGQILISWKAKKALKELLEGWASRSDLECQDGFYYLLGRLNSMHGNSEKAFGFIKEAVSRNPENIDNLLSFAAYLEKNGETQKAIDVYQASYQLVGKSYTQLKFVFCEALHRNGKSENAISILEQHLSKTPNHKMAISLLSKIRGG